MPIIKPILGVFWGCFDVLHVGHVNALEFCRQYCDHLTVGVAVDGYSDNRRQYGNGIESEPKTLLNSQEDRLRMVEALRVVDAAYLYNEMCPKRLWLRLKDRMNVVFLNPEYEGSTVYDEAIRWLEREGVRCIYVPRTENVSTSAIRYQFEHCEHC